MIRTGTFYFLRASGLSCRNLFLITPVREESFPGRSDQQGIPPSALPSESEFSITCSSLVAVTGWDSFYFSPKGDGVIRKGCPLFSDGGGSRRGARARAPSPVPCQEPCPGPESRIDQAPAGTESCPSGQFQPQWLNELDRNPTAAESTLANQHTDAPAKSSKAYPKDERGANSSAQEPQPRPPVRPGPYPAPDPEPLLTFGFTADRKPPQFSY